MRSLRLLVVVVASASIIGCGGSSSPQAEGVAGRGVGQGGTGQGGTGQGGRGQGAGGQGGRGQAGRGGGGPAIPVKAGPVKIQEVVYRIQAVGSLEADELVQVTAELDGVLTEVKFREGDRVSKDTVLAFIDPDRYRLEYERAEANYRKAIAAGEQAAATLSRREALAKEQLLSSEDLNQSRTANDSFAADVAAAKAARDIASQNVAKSAVRPRIRGTVDKRLADTGTFVRTGQNIATLVDISRLLLRFKVSETESLRAMKGQALTFTIAATGDKEFTGQIYHVGEVADPTSRQVEVLAWVKNPGMLKPGFFAEVSLPSGSKKDATVVPETAIQASDRGFVAFVIEDGKAKVRQVEIGLRTGGGDVEILSGLKAGETIVYEGSDRIADGVAVNTDAAMPGAARRPGGPGGGRRNGGSGGGEPGGGGPKGDKSRDESAGAGVSPTPERDKPKGDGARVPKNPKGGRQ